MAHDSMLSKYMYCQDTVLLTFFSSLANAANWPFLFLFFFLKPCSNSVIFVERVLGNNILPEKKSVDLFGLDIIICFLSGLGKTDRVVQARWARPFFLNFLTLLQV